MCSTLPLSGQVDPVRAEAYFKEAKAFCDRDGGRLWGISLCGPMVIADPATGAIATNQPAPEGARPRNLGYANATTKWGGVEWSTFNWKILASFDTPSRGLLMVHELFHRVEGPLGLMTNSPCAVLSSNVKFLQLPNPDSEAGKSMRKHAFHRRRQHNPPQR